MTEAAKVIENIQRDLSIALMNEMALIIHRLGLITTDVLEAAGTRWSFRPLRPGLVGGHCIGVDPYWLTTKAERVGHHLEVILAGWRMNDGMVAFVAQETLRLLSRRYGGLGRAREGVLDASFKENVADLRNSRVPGNVHELESSGTESLVHGPMVDAEEAHAEHGLTLRASDELRDLDALVVTITHRDFRERLHDGVEGVATRDGVVVRALRCRARAVPYRIAARPATFTSGRA